MCHCRRAQVQVPQQLQSDLKVRMEAAGIPVHDTEERWGLAMQALKVRGWISALVVTTSPRPTGVVDVADMGSSLDATDAIWHSKICKYEGDLSSPLPQTQHQRCLRRTCCRGCGRASTTSGRC